MLAQPPRIIRLHYPECGGSVVLEYLPDIATDTIPEPLWSCPHPTCKSTASFPLIGVREILRVRASRGPRETI